MLSDDTVLPLSLVFGYELVDTRLCLRLLAIPCDGSNHIEGLTEDKTCRTLPIILRDVEPKVY